MIAKQSIKFLLKTAAAAFKGKVSTGISNSLGPRASGRLSRVDLGPKPAQAFRSVRAREQYRLATEPLRYQVERARKRRVKLAGLLEQADLVSPISPALYGPPTPQPSTTSRWQDFVVDDEDITMIDNDDVFLEEDDDVVMNDAPEEEYDIDMEFEMEHAVVDEFFDDGNNMRENEPPLPNGIPHSYLSHNRDSSVDMIVDALQKMSSSNAPSRFPSSTTYSSVAARHPGSLHAQYIPTPMAPKRVLPLTALQQILESAAAQRNQTWGARFQSASAPK